jgi:hypothetical protein
MRGLNLGLGASVLVFAAATALSACAQAPDADGLIWPDGPHPDFELMPRLTGEGSEPLNALFTQLDEAALGNRADCLGSGHQYAEWSRTVGRLFTGPRFLSIEINEGYYCGGAHPTVDLYRLTFDRRTGGVPDWATLWPGAEITASTEWPGQMPATTLSPALLEWYRAEVRSAPETDGAWLKQCDGYFGSDAANETLTIWLLDSGRIGVDFASLPHAAMACGSAQFITADEAEALGASAELVGLLREAEAEWIKEYGIE